LGLVFVCILEIRTLFKLSLHFMKISLLSIFLAWQCVSQCIWISMAARFRFLLCWVVLTSCFRLVERARRKQIIRKFGLINVSNHTRKSQQPLPCSIAAWLCFCVDSEFFGGRLLVTSKTVNKASNKWYWIYGLMAMHEFEIQSGLKLKSTKIIFVTFSKPNATKMSDTGCLNKRRLSVVKHFPHCCLEVVTMILPHIHEQHNFFQQLYITAFCTWNEFVFAVGGWSNFVILLVIICHF